MEHFSEFIKAAESPAQQDGNIPVVTEHDTWISVEPVLGCPARCGYCYLVPLGLTGSSPRVRITPRSLVEKLTSYLKDRKRRIAQRTPTPVAIGNYTDMFMSEVGRNWLRDYVPLHAQAFPEYPLCLITKGLLMDDDLAFLDAMGHVILVFLSQSFISESALTLERGPVCTPIETAQNIQKVAKTKHLRPIHFWRPLTERTVPSLKSACDQLDRIQSAGAVASVAIGLKCGHVGDPQDLNRLLGEPMPTIETEYIPPTVLERALEAGRRLGYPVYRNTSCAVAVALAQAEALGTWRPPVRAFRCEPCSCPSEQRARCDETRLEDNAPTPGTMMAIAAGLKVGPEHLSWNLAHQAIVIDAEVAQDDHARMVHLFGFRLQPRSIRATLAWAGAILERYDEHP